MILPCPVCGGVARFGHARCRRVRERVYRRAWARRQAIARRPTDLPAAVIDRVIARELAQMRAARRRVA